MSDEALRAAAATQDLAAPERAVEVLEQAIAIGVVDGRTLAGLDQLQTDPPLDPESWAQLAQAAVGAGITTWDDVVVPDPKEKK